MTVPLRLYVENELPLYINAGGARARYPSNWKEVRKLASSKFGVNLDDEPPAPATPLQKRVYGTVDADVEGKRHLPVAERLRLLRNGGYTTTPQTKRQKAEAVGEPEPEVGTKRAGKKKRPGCAPKAKGAAKKGKKKAVAGGETSVVVGPPPTDIDGGDTPTDIDGEVVTDIGATATLLGAGSARPAGGAVDGVDGTGGDATPPDGEEPDKQEQEVVDGAGGDATPPDGGTTSKQDGGSAPPQEVEHRIQFSRKSKGVVASKEGGTAPPQEVSY